MDLITTPLLLRWFGGLLAVGGLLLLFMVALRHWQNKGGKIWGKQLGQLNKLTNSPKRLHVLESRWLDAKHRAILLQADDTEHLLILGGQQPVELKK